MKNIYTALIISVALVKLLEFLLGFTAAIAIPKYVFEQLGAEFGLFVVNVFTITLPCFLVSLALLPLLGILAGPKTANYSLFTLVGFFVISVLETGLNNFAASYVFVIPFALCCLSILAAGWLVGKRYAVT